MNEAVYSFTPEALHLVGEARLAYVRKVYSYFGLGLLSAAFASIFAMNSPLVFMMARSPILSIVLFIGLMVFANRSATNAKRAVPTLVAATFMTGLIFSPVLYGIAHNLIPGSSVNTICNALIISITIYAGLTAY